MEANHLLIKGVPSDLEDTFSLSRDLEISIRKQVVSIEISPYGHMCLACFDRPLSTTDIHEINTVLYNKYDQHAKAEKLSFKHVHNMVWAYDLPENLQLIHLSLHLDTEIGDGETEVVMDVTEKEALVHFPTSDDAQNALQKDQTIMQKRIYLTRCGEGAQNMEDQTCSVDLEEHSTKRSVDQSSRRTQNQNTAATATMFSNDQMHSGNPVAREAGKHLSKPWEIPGDQRWNQLPCETWPRNHHWQHPPDKEAQNVGTWQHERNQSDQNSKCAPSQLDPGKKVCYSKFSGQEYGYTYSKDRRSDESEFTQDAQAPNYANYPGNSYNRSGEASYGKFDDHQTAVSLRYQGTSGGLQHSQDARDSNYTDSRQTSCRKFDDHQTATGAHYKGSSDRIQHPHDSQVSNFLGSDNVSYGMSTGQQTTIGPWDQGNSDRLQHSQGERVLNFTGSGQASYGKFGKHPEVIEPWYQGSSDSHQHTQDAREADYSNSSYEGQPRKSQEHQSADRDSCNYHGRGWRGQSRRYPNQKFNHERCHHGNRRDFDCENYTDHGYNGRGRSMQSHHRGYGYRPQANSRHNVGDVWRDGHRTDNKAKINRYNNRRPFPRGSRYSHQDIPYTDIYVHQPPQMEEKNNTAKGFYDHKTAENVPKYMASSDKEPNWSDSIILKSADKLKLVDIALKRNCLSLGNCKHKIDIESGKVILEGPKSETDNLKMEIYEWVNSADEHSLDISPELAQLLQGNKTFLEEHKIIALVGIKNDKPYILTSGSDETDIRDKLMALLDRQVSKYTNLHREYMKSDKWSGLQKHLTSESILIITVKSSKEKPTHGEIIVEGEKKAVKGATDKIRKELKEGAVDMKTIPLKCGVARLIKEEKTRLDDIKERSGADVSIQRNRGSFELNVRGQQDILDHGMKLAKELEQEVEHDSKILTNKGIEELVTDEKFKTSLYTLEQRNSSVVEMTSSGGMQHRNSESNHGNQTRKETERYDKDNDPRNSSDGTGITVFTHEDVEIVAIQGNITEFEADVLVNTIAGSDVMLDKGGRVCAAFHKAGGQRLQQDLDEEVNKYMSGSNHANREELEERLSEKSRQKVIITRPHGDLRQYCDKIFHINIGKWTSKTERELTELIQDCLYRAAKVCRKRSIAFPVVGSGGLKYPQDVVVKCFERAASFAGRKGGRIKIFIVAYDKRTLNQTIDEFGGPRHRHSATRGASFRRDRDDARSYSGVNHGKGVEFQVYAWDKDQAKETIRSIERLVESSLIKITIPLGEDAASDEELIRRLKKMNSPSLSVWVDTRRCVAIVSGPDNMVKESQIRIESLLQIYND